MKHRLATFVVLLVTLIFTGSSRGQGFNFGGLSATTAEPLTVRAAVNRDALVPGTSAEIAVELTINSQYHIQSAFAPDPYIAAHVAVKPADGISFAPIQAQKATDIPSPPALGVGTLSVYQGKSYFLIPITISPTAAPGNRTLELTLVTQACTDTTCLPPKTTRLQIQTRIATLGATSAEIETSLFTAAHKVSFSPMPAPQPATAASRPATTLANSGPGKEVPLLTTDQQLAEIAKRPYTPFNTAEQQHTLPAILLFALFGGLILNFMPCVLPVIPLKALSFVQHAHGNPRIAMQHSLAFSAGIISLFITLAIALRTFGLFYGQQFQSPGFLITMTLFVVALALSMLNVWTISPPQAVYALDAKIAETSTSRAYLGSFGNGLMATLLATPCSAPFLGPVFAYAFTQPAWLTALMLTLVGVGMSLPYLFLAAFPKLLNRIPRAGRWSELMKQGLGIVMLAVAIYLVTLIPNIQLWPWVLAAGIVTALVCWGWGQIPSPLMSPAEINSIRAVVVAVGLLLGTGIFWIAHNLIDKQPPINTGTTAVLPDTSDGRTWLPFNVALLDQALKDNRPVVVDWTADWCINCRALEALVLSRDEMQSAFRDSNALLLRADLSRENPPATALNAKLGGEAIPVLAIFLPGRPTQPTVLRDSYSLSRVKSELSSGR